MTKKHFEFIAETLSPLKFELTPADFKLVVEQFSDKLLETNEQFDYMLFENECGVSDVEVDEEGLV